MNVKNKAEEFIFQYKQYADWNNEYGSAEQETNILKAKKCAIIAIDEIIEEVRDYCDFNYSNDRMIFWHEVKKEINKL